LGVTPALKVHYLKNIQIKIKRYFIMDSYNIFTPHVKDYCDEQLEPFLEPLDLTLQYDLDFESLEEITKMCIQIDPVYIDKLYYWKVYAEKVYIVNGDDEILGVLICENVSGDGAELHLICTDSASSGIGSLLMTTFLIALKQREFSYVHLDVADGFNNTNAVCLYDKFGFVESPFRSTSQLDMTLNLNDITEEEIIDICSQRVRRNAEPLCNLPKTARRQYGEIREDVKYDESHKLRSVQEAKRAFTAEIASGAIKLRRELPRRPGGKAPRRDLADILARRAMQAGASVHTSVPVSRKLLPVTLRPKRTRKQPHCKFCSD
jgi:GNAT superfamily N-acetyltransferase